MSEMKYPMSALGYLEREDGKILCVWNRAYNGWGLPGGKGEPGEVPEETCVRELLEETGVLFPMLTPLYDALSVTGTGIHVYVFKVLKYDGLPGQREMDSPVKWLTKEELIQSSPFKEFYLGMFKSIGGKDV